MHTINRYIFATAMAVAALQAAGSDITFPGRDAAQVGVVVVDLATGKDVATINPSTVMTPASILKTVTSAAALSINGPDSQYTTTVSAQGPINGGRLEGNILITASGDPTIASKHFDAADTFTDSIVANLHAMGITSVSGDIIFDQSSFPNPGQIPQWAVEDVGWNYGAAPYGFNYADNVMKLYASDGRTEPEDPMVDVIVDPKAPHYEVTRGINSYTYIISNRHAAEPNYYYTTTVNDPSVVYANLLTKRLASEGITVEGDVVTTQRPVVTIYEHRSPRNADILRSLVTRSDNMMAEASLRSIAPGKTRDEALKREKEWLESKGIATAPLRIVDGSGLARSNRISPHMLATLLAKMASSPYSKEYVGLFPRVGKEGTVKNFFKRTRLEGKLALKSGSMNGVLCYAGYLLDGNSQPTHAVVVMINGYYCSTADAKKGIETFLLKYL